MCRTGGWRRGTKSCPKKERAAVIIENKIEIFQNTDARGGDGGSANGGSAAGGSAAAAAAAGEDARAAATVITTAVGADDATLVPAPDQDQEQAEVTEDLDDVESASASAAGGSATGGAGGTGGSGGAGGTASTSASVQIDNMVIVCCNGNGPDQAIKLGTNGRKVDVTVDKDGNTSVNGKKMDEQELEDGTKVFIFRNIEE